MESMENDNKCTESSILQTLSNCYPYQHFCQNGEYDPRKHGTIRHERKNDDHNDNENTINHNDDQSLEQELFVKWWKEATDNLFFSNYDHTGDKKQEQQQQQLQQQKEWFEKLYKHHNEETRFYHTPVHLYEMLYCLDMLNPRSKNHSDDNDQDNSHPDNHDKNDQQQTKPSVFGLSSLERQIIILCIFFHDVIYDPHSTTNEEDSAKCFQQFIDQLLIVHQQQQQQLSKERETLLSLLQSIVVPFILATKSHNHEDKTAIQAEATARNVAKNMSLSSPLPSSSVSSSSSSSCSSSSSSSPSSSSFSNSSSLLLNLFLDLDMAVLGKESDAYMHYAACIRKEYEYVPSPIYCTKRAEILTSFLTNKSIIYHTHWMQQLLEQRARANLAFEIHMLQQGQIPNAIGTI